ncbi:beta-1,3-galactosyltransferase 5-like [Bemisia tabaci]|uniref:beta-1,3-galactosyltransferase 5-like n=1 Tax=Bemisia tabaci TaxID=7038 RepID=UPI003B27E896
MTILRIPRWRHRLLRPSLNLALLVFFTIATLLCIFDLLLHSTGSKRRAPLRVKPYSPEDFDPNDPDAVEYINNTAVGDLYDPGFDIRNSELCPASGEDLKFAILVPSARGNFHKRMAIRQTWGSFAQRKDIVVAFVVGRPGEASDPASDLPSSVEEESELYGDIIAGRFVDSYANLTLKITAMLEWSMTFCSKAQFIIKADDDVFLNIPKLLDLVESDAVLATRTIFGQLFKGWHPVRDRRDRNYVPETVYAPPTFPDYIRGLSYVITGDLVRELYDKALESPYFFLEDAFYTGFLLQAVGGERVGISAAFTYRDRKCNFRDDHWMGVARVRELFDLWNKFLVGRPRCMF